MKIALISCVKRKRNGCCAAKDLYSSTLFKLAWEYVNQHFDKVFILSAKHGLLEPEKHINNYNITLNDMSVFERKQWARKVAEQIRQVINTEDELHFFCGRKYRDFIIELFPERRCFSPLAGLGIGRQLHWYKSRL